MRKPIKIGKKEYKLKKDAIAHYRSILNSYDFKQSLSDEDLNDIIDLLNFAYLVDLAESEHAEGTVEDEHELEEGKTLYDEVVEDLQIVDVKIAKVQFNTKCFEVFYSDQTSEYISYLMLLNNSGYSPDRLFNIACRNSILSDIRSAKQTYFDKNAVKGRVKCQETNTLSGWTELVVDHRQPNTFSVIVDRFKEVYKIKVETIEYSTSNQNHIIFKDQKLAEDFRQYHKEKANLRLVRKECNSGRTGMARIKRTSKDLNLF